MSEAKTHGMAQEIRALRDSEEFDLANYDGAQASALMKASFSNSIQLPAGKMIRVTFVIGGGKKVRQKYPETLAKDLTQALTSLGFDEDRGACCDLQCQGSFKYQHDTDKDLKFMHVFPHVETIKEAAQGTDEFGADLPSEAARQVVSCELWEFQALVKQNASSFVQQRSLLKVMKGVASRFEEFDKKLINMQTLEPEEQELFSRGVSIGDKVSWLEGSLEDIIVKGPLTKAEQLYVVADLQQKVDQIEETIAQQKEKGKKVEKLEEKLKVLQEKCAQAAQIKPLPPKKGPDMKELEDLRKRLAALNKIESKKGLLTPDESKELAKKPNLEENLKKLEAGMATGWFDSKVREVEALIKPQESKRVRPQSAAPSRPQSARPVSAVGRSSRPTGGQGVKTTQNMYAMLGDED